MDIGHVVLRPLPEGLHSSLAISIAVRRVTERLRRLGDASTLLGRVAHEAHRTGITDIDTLQPGEYADGRDSPNLLRINGHLCRAVQCQKLSEAVQQYGRIQVTRASLIGVDFLIVWFHPEEFPEAFLLVPGKEVNRTLFPATSTRTCAPLLFRADPPPGYGKRPPRLDVWCYKNAWHLLRVPKE